VKKHIRHTVLPQEHAASGFHIWDIVYADVARCRDVYVGLKMLKGDKLVKVMYSFVDWAISNPDGFIAITDGFTDGEQKIFVEGFSDAIFQSSREREFKNAFMAVNK
jgi:hypothetical protein